MSALIVILLFCSSFLLVMVLPTGSGKEQPDVEALIAPENLSRGSLSEAAYAFKQEVYRLHVARGVELGRPRIYDLPLSEMAEVPDTGIVMRRAAAHALGQLLAAARVDLLADLADHGTDSETSDRHGRALCVREIGLDNAYRSATTQFGIWDRNFAEYYAVTRSERRQSAGGEHGPDAAHLLRDFISVWVAAPGFSNHQGGIAVDFALRLKTDTHSPEGGDDLGASRSQVDPWKVSWLWDWLNRRAGEFGFVPYLPEPWHWEYSPERVGAQ